MMASSIDTCRLSVKGEPGATHGRFTKDREGTVRSFCINRTQAYTMLYQHVKKCPTCDPEDVLRALLDNRSIAHLGGMVSTGMVSLALKMSKVKGKRVSRETMREFVWRRCDVAGLLYGRDGVDGSEVVRGLALTFAYRVWTTARDNDKKGNGVRNRYSATDEVNRMMRNVGGSAARYCYLGREVARIFDRDGAVSPEHPELRDLCTVADVLCA